MKKEFYNKYFKETMNKNKINHYSTFSSKKTSIVERVNRTLKQCGGNLALKVDEWVKILLEIVVNIIIKSLAQLR